MQLKRVVVTGLGALTPIGNSTQEARLHPLEILLRNTGKDL
jgi:3-oxoacyl-(acyl-carrier-protein) synthase